MQAFFVRILTIKYCFLVVCCLRMNVLCAQDPAPSDSTRVDDYFNLPYEPSSAPRFRLRDRRAPSLVEPISGSPLYKPSNALKRTFSLDTARNLVIHEDLYGLPYRAPTKMSFAQARRYFERQSVRSFWKNRSLELDGESVVEGRKLNPRVYIGPWSERIFGGEFVEFQPNILLTIDLGSRWDKVENPSLPINRQRNWLLDLRQQLSANVTGKIGEKLNITFNYDTQAPFSSFNVDLKNNLRIEYTGFEEEIIKKLVLGNVSINTGNSLIRGSQSLFGLEFQLQFGRLYITQVLTAQKANADNLLIENGEQESMFNVLASEYMDNQHYFLGHFFRDNYESWLSSLPQVISGINITRVEVYVLNRSSGAENIRNILAFTDLGENYRLLRSTNAQAVAQASAPNNNDANTVFARVRGQSALRDLENVDNILIGFG